MPTCHQSLRATAAPFGALKLMGEQIQGFKIENTGRRRRRILSWRLSCSPNRTNRIALKGDHTSFEGEPLIGDRQLRANCGLLHRVSAADGTVRDKD